MKMKMLRLYFYHHDQLGATWPGKCLAYECCSSYPIFHHIWLATGADPNLDVMQGWKSLTTADAVISIKAAKGEVKQETINALGT